MTDDITDKEAAVILARASMTHPPLSPIRPLSRTPRPDENDESETARTGREIEDEEIQNEIDRDEWFAEIADEDPEEPLTEEEADAFDHALRNDD